MSNITTTNSLLDADGKKRIVVVILILVIGWGLFFLEGGTGHWTAAWVYVALQLGVFLAVGLPIIRINPEIINERGRKSDKTKSWDKVFSAVYSPQIFLMPLIVRNALEDATLQAELPVFCDYARRTRYRLLPDVW